MPIPFIALLPSIMSALGMGAQHFGSRNAINRQNRYNDPASQVKRMREAGLPMAALDGTAQAGSQSQAQPTNFQEGTNQMANEISKHALTNMQKKQMELIDAQIQATGAQAAASAQQAQKLANENQIFEMDPTVEGMVSMGARTAQQQYRMKELELSMAGSEDQIKRLDSMAKTELFFDGTTTNRFREELESLIQSNKRARLLYDTEEKQSRAIKVLIDSMSKDGMSTGEAFLHLLMQGGIRSVLPNLGTETGLRY